ncbi:MAG: GH116 family glycosyl-hydrolase [Verrucomicrobiia bacterium]
MNPENRNKLSSHLNNCFIRRREFLKALGFSGVVIGIYPLLGELDMQPDFDKLIPADKKLAPDWVKSLFERGTQESYYWDESEKIGMPIGGICAGQLYLGGDGKLWHWDIFNKLYNSGTGGPHYANPMKPQSPLEQGFAILMKFSNGVQTRSLDHSGWEKVKFTGEYPIGIVEYSDPSAPVDVVLEAFSPFIPLNPEDSSLPATIMRFTIKNKTNSTVDIQLAGWLENAVCINSAAEIDGVRKNRIFENNRYIFLESVAEQNREKKQTKADIVFEDFESGKYEKWEVTGTAFGNAPVERNKIPSYQGDVGGSGKYVVNSHASAPGDNVEEKDSHTGSLLSREFLIERDYITFFVGGGAHKGRTCVNLLVDGSTVFSTTGKNDNKMSPAVWNVKKYLGKKARIQILDIEKGSWGNIGVDRIVFTDNPSTGAPEFEKLPDYGSMGLALIKSGKKSAVFEGNSQLPPANIPSVFKLDSIVKEASSPFGKKLVGSLSESFKIKPSGSEEVVFIVVWYFPNIQMSGLSNIQGRHYGKRFKTAREVANYVAENLDRLTKQTRLWRDTWYDSTLPYWFLNRTFATVSHLATNTCYWFGNGRFYAYEGVGCCEGTCTHVWHYAQAVARLFPQFERYLREFVDYGVAFDESTGRIRFRGEYNNHWAVDGQAGVVLRTYREHQMSADNQFLKRVWNRCKKAVHFLIQRDVNQDGIIDGPQHNTLDTDWYGEIAWLSGMYVSALRAAQLMAEEMGDSEFAQLCGKIYERGKQRIEQDLFNGEYFINKCDKNRLDTINSGLGCHIDQVLGDAWAEQLGFAPILDNSKVISALKSLWRYNFCPEIGVWRKVNKPGRWYALPGEAGLIMCTFPVKGWDYSMAKGKGADWAAGYFNECMTGFEYQVAWHSISKDIILEGLAITRAIHDRYHPSKRNPYNEIECGDHYARAMASYGVFLSICGFISHCPQGRLEFKPRLNPQNFKSAFTAAEGWGSYSQKFEQDRGIAIIEVKYGSVDLNQIVIGLPQNIKPSQITVTHSRQKINATLDARDSKAIIKLEKRIKIKEGERFEVLFA